jgi:hypothetical protein
MAPLKIVNDGLPLGRVTVRNRPGFVVNTAAGRIEVQAKHLNAIQRRDGYAYSN